MFCRWQLEAFRMSRFVTVFCLWLVKHILLYSCYCTAICTCALTTLSLWKISALSNSYDSCHDLVVLLSYSPTVRDMIERWWSVIGRWMGGLLYFVQRGPRRVIAAPSPILTAPNETVCTSTADVLIIYCSILVQHCNIFFAAHVIGS